jgi:exonuclease III
MPREFSKESDEWWKQHQEQIRNQIEIKKLQRKLLPKRHDRLHDDIAVFSKGLLKHHEGRLPITEYKIMHAEKLPEPVSTFMDLYNPNKALIVQSFHEKFTSRYTVELSSMEHEDSAKTERIIIIIDTNFGNRHLDIQFQNDRYGSNTSIDQQREQCEALLNAVMKDFHDLETETWMKKVDLAEKIFDYVDKTASTKVKSFPIPMSK